MYLLFILSVYMFPPSILAHVFNGIVLFFHYYTKINNNEIVFSLYWYSRVITFKFKNALYIFLLDNFVDNDLFRNYVIQNNLHFA